MEKQPEWNLVHAPPKDRTAAWAMAAELDHHLRQLHYARAEALWLAGEIRRDSPLLLHQAGMTVPARSRIAALGKLLEESKDRIPAMRRRIDTAKWIETPVTEKETEAIENAMREAEDIAGNIREIFMKLANDKPE